MVSVSNIARQLAGFTPSKAPDRHSKRRSAVTLLLRGGREGGAEILMIERAEREGDPWSGHMGFPGGRLDAADAHSFGAAVRETREEIGLEVGSDGQYLGRLSDVSTHLRSGVSAMLVTPYVFSIGDEQLFTPNDEVADILWVPLAFFADPTNRESMEWRYEEYLLHLPCYHFQGKRIWGLSLGMLDEFLAVSGIAEFEPMRLPL